MKTKLIFSTEKNDIEQWTDLPFIPRVGEWFNLKDILSVDEIAQIKASARGWSIRSMIRSSNIGTMITSFMLSWLSVVRNNHVLNSIT